MSWLVPHAETECCYVGTTGRRSGHAHEVEIWFGVLDDTLYLISGNGPGADWYRGMATRRSASRSRRGASTSRCWPSRAGVASTTGRVSFGGMRRRFVIPVVVMVVAFGACTAQDQTANSGLTLPPPDEPETLLPVFDDTEPPDVTDTVPTSALFQGDICTALAVADFARVFGNGVRLDDSGPLALDTCLYLLRLGSKQIDVRIALSSIEEFTAPEVRNLPDAVPTMPTNPDPGTVPQTSPTTDAATIPPVTEVVTASTVESTIEATIDELNGIGLGSRGLRQGIRYEVYAKVDNGFFSVLAPNRNNAIALAKLVVEHISGG